MWDLLSLPLLHHLPPRAAQLLFPPLHSFPGGPVPVRLSPLTHTHTLSLTHTPARKAASPTDNHGCTGRFLPAPRTFCHSEHLGRWVHWTGSALWTYVIHFKTVLRMLVIGHTQKQEEESGNMYESKSDLLRMLASNGADLTCEHHLT